MSPQYPAPGDTVRLTVSGDSTVDLANSAITWLVNGKKVSQDTGNTILDMKVGPLGKETSVDVRVAPPDGADTSTSVVILPTQVDLLVDSDSYTPPFYEGRALPSAGTQLHLQAIAHLKRTNGSSVPASAITYTWRQNDRVVGSISGKGRQSVTLPSPALYGTDTISVEASSGDGLSGSATVRISATEPVLVLYKDHPLFGIMYHQAMGDETRIPDSEMTFAAVPYFAQIKNPNDPRLQYSWSVNDSDIQSNPGNPSEIIVNADNSSGLATINLSLIHSNNFFMNAKGAWGVSFRTTGQTANPFTSIFQ